MTAALKLTRKNISTIKDQDHAAQKVVLNRVRGQFNQIAAVVEGTNLHVLGQNLAVELLCFLLHVAAAQFESARRGASE